VSSATDESAAGTTAARARARSAAAPSIGYPRRGQVDPGPTDLPMLRARTVVCAKTLPTSPSRSSSANVRTCRDPCVAPCAPYRRYALSSCRSCKRQRCSTRSLNPTPGWGAAKPYMHTASRWCRRPGRWQQWAGLDVRRTPGWGVTCLGPTPKPRSPASGSARRIEWQVVRRTWVAAIPVSIVGCMMRIPSRRIEFAPGSRTTS
jgi:hypothetical protein